MKKLEEAENDYSIAKCGRPGDVAFRGYDYDGDFAGCYTWHCDFSVQTEAWMQHLHPYVTVIMMMKHSKSTIELVEYLCYVRQH